MSETYADLHIGADNEEEGGKEGNNPERRCHYPDGHLQPSPVRVQTREPEPYEEGVQHYGQRDEYILPKPGAVERILSRGVLPTGLCSVFLHGSSIWFLRSSE